jgi:NAD(P)-dependent dehydrogenase (short-subunit alcohol dehydrogenase family)
MARFIREYEPDMMTAMVTGAAGVLGRATVRMLLEEGFRVCPLSLRTQDFIFFPVSLHRRRRICVCGQVGM